MPIIWPIDSTHSLTISSYTQKAPERNYFAAIISAQTANFRTYLSSADPIIRENLIVYSLYGVLINLENPKEYIYPIFLNGFAER